MDDYSQQPGLRELLRRAEEESVNAMTRQSTEEVEHKIHVLRRFNDANAACIEELQRTEKAIQCRRAWERHAIGLMVASADPIEADVEIRPALESDDRIARIARDIQEEQHPVLSRVGGSQ
jgi:hypothetical protein